MRRHHPGGFLIRKGFSAAIPTVQLALQAGADAVILCSHLGRPGGKVDSKLSLDIVASYSQEQLKVEVNFISDCIGEDAKRACENATGGAVILLENLRFHPEEEGKPLKMGDGTKKAQDPADIARVSRSAHGVWNCICERCLWNRSQGALIHGRLAARDTCSRAAPGEGAQILCKGLGGPGTALPVFSEGQKCRTRSSSSRTCWKSATN